MHPNHTPYFSDNITDYAPWVAMHGLLQPYGECQCGCGKKTTISPSNEKMRGYSKGQPRRFIARHGRTKNLTNLRFGRLVAIALAERIRGRKAWLCQCDCGNQIAVDASHLQGGRTKSCGCLPHDQLLARNAKHGLSHHWLYGIWCGMNDRCARPNFKQYKDYGGRGISVCDEWRHDFQAFYDHVFQLPHYGETGYTLDRIDNDGNYEPGNVRWATRKEQRRNSRPARAH